jgi:hypothetical protein
VSEVLDGNAIIPDADDEIYDENQASGELEQSDSIEVQSSKLIIVDRLPSNLGDLESAQEDTNIGFPMNRNMLKALQASTGIESSYPSGSDIAYSARVFAQVSMPYKEPKGNPAYWERRNGDTSLIVRPALLVDEKTGDRYSAYPFGMVPRYVLTWMATEAFLTNSPELELGHSMGSFARKVGINYGGNDRNRVKEHLQRLLGAQILVDGRFTTGNVRAEQQQSFSITKGSTLFSSTDAGGEVVDIETLWPSTVTLHENLFQSIIDGPVPLDARALKALGKSPMRTDMYLWFTYRMSWLERPSKIKWETLNAQFGAQYKRTRAFKESFIEHLKYVQAVYHRLNVEVFDDYLLLNPSPTSVLMRPPTRRAIGE